MKVYLVGGAVRDELLGLPIKERDWVVVNGSVQEMEQQGFVSVGKSFPVFLHPKTKEEYALAREETSTAKGYHGFSFNTSKAVTLEDDLKRRDLTINAIAKADDGVLVDPYGGQDDLNKKVLRHVSEAFIEDPVRVLRIARFAARFNHMGFTIAPETLALMKKMVKEGELDHLVPERVFKELERALGEASPEVFIRTLRQCGALSVLMPEIDNLYGVPQSLEHHPEKDAGIHIEYVLKAAASLTPLTRVRFAALMHDVGKGTTPKEVLPHHPEHEKRGGTLTRALCERLRVPKDFQELAMIVTQYHGDCHAIMDKGPEAILSLLEKCDAFRRPDRFQEFLLACLADARGRPGFEATPYPQQERLAQALKAAQNVNIGQLVGTLPKAGDVIKEAVSKARLDAIENTLFSPGETKR